MEYCSCSGIYYSDGFGLDKMKEKDFINLISQITRSKYIGDDCAYLKNLDIVVSQDNLVEDVHFSKNFATPFQIGYKSAMVNISDICASGAEPKYMSIGLSLPKNISENFIKEFYEGIKQACDETGEIEITGGDLTASDKIFISVTVIGTCKNRKISSRKNAKEGYKIIVSGKHGLSGAGLKDLKENKQSKFIENHLMPKARVDFSKYISQNIKAEYAMMDSSDGLADALMQIAEQSRVLLSVDFEKIPHDKDLEKYPNWQDLILYGGEDYELVACVPQNFIVPDSFEIGRVKQGFGVEIDGRKINFSNKIFKHFE